MSKLPHQIITNNEQALNQFLQNARESFISDNGMVQTFKAHVTYDRKGDEQPLYCRKVTVHVSALNIGGYKVNVGALNPENFFNEFNTSFQRFCYSNDVLTIDGTDDFQTGKGDYKVCISL